MPNLIDRDELKDRLKWGWVNGKFVLRTIDEMPTVEAEPVKHGHWIEWDDARIHGVCSACGWKATILEEDVYGMPYCPNCGARMNLGEDDGD